jgi:hypothetical protein
MLFITARTTTNPTKVNVRKAAVKLKPRAAKCGLPRLEHTDVKAFEKLARSEELGKLKVCDAERRREGLVEWRRAEPRSKRLLGE